MWVVVDHLKGTRRGQRQELEIDESPGNRLAIGRHPDCDVSFDTRRDLEASTRHAELRAKDGVVSLIDIGSSNGTYVDGERVSDVALPAGEPIIVEFGAAGPQLRIWWDPSASPSAAPELPRTGVPWPLYVSLAIAAGVTAIIVIRWLT